MRIKSPDLPVLNWSMVLVQPRLVLAFSLSQVRHVAWLWEQSRRSSPFTVHAELFAGLAIASLLTRISQAVTFDARKNNAYLLGMYGARWSPPLNVQCACACLSPLGSRRQAGFLVS